jgi:hypothetical protein
MSRLNYHELHRRVTDAVNGKSDRDAVITIVSWVDHLLKCKAEQVGAARAGASWHLKGRIDAAHRDGWIDRELRDDLHRLRSLRNTFAHSVDVSSLSDTIVQATLAALRVPARQYHDWDTMGAVATLDGSVVLYSGTRPAEGVEDLTVGGLRFKLGLSVIFAVLLASLELDLESGGKAVVLDIPAHLRTPSGE